MASAWLCRSRVGAFRCQKWNRCYSKLSHGEGEGEDAPPSSGICRPLSEILKELNKKVPDSLVKTRLEKDGFPIRYIPWHLVNRILNLHAPEWSGEVRNITYSADAKSVSVVYRVTLYGTDAEDLWVSVERINGSEHLDDEEHHRALSVAEAPLILIIHDTQWTAVHDAGVHCWNVKDI